MHSSSSLQVRPNASLHVRQFLQRADVTPVTTKHLLQQFEASRTDVTAAGGASDAEAGVDVGGDAKSKWFYISDSRVVESSESKALQCQAYLLFYERIH